MTATCFTCKTESAGNDYAGPFSAYCAGCQPKGGFSPSGKACVCLLCGRWFTAVSAFDLHQRLSDGGPVICLDPAVATKGNGNPMFATYRNNAEGGPVWGRYDAEGKPHRRRPSTDLPAS